MNFISNSLLQSGNCVVVTITRTVLQSLPGVNYKLPGLIRSHTRNPSAGTIPLQLPGLYHSSCRDYTTPGAGTIPLQLLGLYHSSCRYYTTPGAGTIPLQLPGLYHSSCRDYTTPVAGTIPLQLLGPEHSILYTVLCGISHDNHFMRMKYQHFYHR